VPSIRKNTEIINENNNNNNNLYTKIRLDLNEKFEDKEININNLRINGNEIGFYQDGSSNIKNIGNNNNINNTDTDRNIETLNDNNCFSLNIDYEKTEEFKINNKSVDSSFNKNLKRKNIFAVIFILLIIIFLIIFLGNFLI
jgi:hypothetical protein